MRHRGPPPRLVVLAARVTAAATVDQVGRRPVLMGLAAVLEVILATAEMAAVVTTIRQEREVLTSAVPLTLALIISWLMAAAELVFWVRALDKQKLQR